MKKILLTAAFFAVASLNSFGAVVGPCSNFSTLAALAAIGGVDTCSVTNGTNTWQLTNFGFSTVSPSAQTGFPGGQPLTSDIAVSFAAASGVGTNGFTVTFSDAAGGNNFFNTVAQNPNPNQTASWKSIFVIDSGTAAITGVNSSLNNGTTGGAGQDQGSIVLQKIITNAVTNANPTIGDVTLTMSGNTALTTYTGAVSNMAGNSAARLGVVDNFQINGGNLTGTSFANLSSYSNTFLTANPPTGVPEPMSFVLMGAGLVGIAALRRRKA